MAESGSSSFGDHPTGVIVTGVAGFIGFHLTRRLLSEGLPVTGVDCLNSYYPKALKLQRLEILKAFPNFRFEHVDIADAEALEDVFERADASVVVNLAAQVGVRASIDHPERYIRDNLVGFGNILECTRRHGTRQLIYASSSSVYGGLPQDGPYRTDVPADEPLNLYAATKRANELLAHAYSSLYGMKTVGLRFFTVYGPWGRPDMLYFKIAEKMAKGEVIDIYGDGDQERDFTYVDDIVAGIHGLMRPHDARSTPFRVYNIGYGQKSTVNQMLDLFEENLGIEARRRYLEPAAGDMYSTLADIGALVRDTGVTPQVPLDEGIPRFLAWHAAFTSDDTIIDLTAPERGSESAPATTSPALPGARASR